MVIDMEPAVFQNRFWLKIMSDHMQFILTSISPKEKKEIDMAQSLFGMLEGLLMRSRESLADNQIKQLNQEAYPIVQNVRKFKLHLLKRQLNDHIELDLQPGVINRLISEAEEYLNILASLMKNGDFMIPTIRLHLLWLMDASGHAGLIMDGINMSYRNLKLRSHDFERDFLILYARAAEIQGFIRTGLKKFPAFEQFNMDVEEALNSFAEFFVLIKSQLQSKRVLGTISTLWLDHMYREGCYYLTELSKVCKINAPVCDPTATEVF